jgi:hypothetical protein
MTYRKAAPPPVCDGMLGADATLHGAAAIGLDHVTSGGALADWAKHRS